MSTKEICARIASMAGPASVARAERAAVLRPPHPPCHVPAPLLPDGRRDWAAWCVLVAWSARKVTRAYDLKRHHHLNRHEMRRMAGTEIGARLTALIHARHHEIQAVSRKRRNQTAP